MGFALAMQARHDDRRNRVHFRCGLVVRLPVLSTLPRGNAVPVDYRIKPKPPGKDLHPTDAIPSRTHIAQGETLVVLHIFLFSFPGRGFRRFSTEKFIAESNVVKTLQAQPHGLWSRFIPAFSTHIAPQSGYQPYHLL